MALKTKNILLWLFTATTLAFAWFLFRGFIFLYEQLASSFFPDVPIEIGGFIITFIIILILAYILRKDINLKRLLRLRR